MLFLLTACFFSLSFAAIHEEEIKKFFEIVDTHSIAKLLSGTERIALQEWYQEGEAKPNLQEWYQKLATNQFQELKQKQVFKESSSNKAKESFIKAFQFCLTEDRLEPNSNLIEAHSNYFRQFKGEKNEFFRLSMIKDLKHQSAIEKELVALNVSPIDSQKIFALLEQYKKQISNEYPKLQILNSGFENTSADSRKKRELKVALEVLQNRPNSAGEKFHLSMLYRRLKDIPREVEVNSAFSDCSLPKLENFVAQQIIGESIESIATPVDNMEGIPQEETKITSQQADSNESSSTFQLQEIPVRVEHEPSIKNSPSDESSESLSSKCHQTQPKIEATQPLIFQPNNSHSLAPPTSEATLVPKQQPRLGQESNCCRSRQTRYRVDISTTFNTRISRSQILTVRQHVSAESDRPFNLHFSSNITVYTPALSSQRERRCIVPRQERSNFNELKLRAKSYLSLIQKKLHFK